MNSLPNILISKQFEVSNINDSFTDVIWKSAILNVDDNISFGETRQVEIEYYQESEYTYLRTVYPLSKTEFEEMFNFKPGEFIKGRIISIKSNKIIIKN